ncbi:MAG: ectoine utilization protein EutA [Rhodobacteraceae bacterium]|nr:ectoine utilization protein EutA [Paracoccaceae bacterium]
MNARGKAEVETVLRPVGFRSDVPRLGVILLATDLTTERDIARTIPPGRAGVHATRVAYANPTTPENLRRMLPLLAGATELIVPGLPLAAVAFACTAASSVLGDDAVREAVQSVRPGVPVITPAGAARRAFAALGLRRIALLTPYLPETTRPVIDFFETEGIEIMRATCLGIDDDRRMALADDATILAAAEEADHPSAEALFISCTALPAMALAAEIEMRLGKPVVTSNQASIREMRAAAGITEGIAGFGITLAGADMRGTP